MQEKDFSEIEIKNNICINVFSCEIKLTFPVYISDQQFENSNVFQKSHYVSIKCFDRFMFHKTKNKNNIGTIAFKNYFKQLPAAFKCYAGNENALIPKISICKKMSKFQK